MAQRKNNNNRTKAAIKRAPYTKTMINLTNPAKLGKDICHAVSIPDLQMSYRFHDQGAANGGELILDPTHDEQAISLTLSMLRWLRPKYIIIQGDALDIPNLSSWKNEPSMNGIFQSSIDRMAQLLTDLKKICKNIIWVHGNHEARFYDWMAENSPELFGLTKGSLAGFDGGREVVIDIGYLTRANELGIEQVPYRKGGLYGWWLPDTETTLFAHGDKVSSSCTGYNYLKSTTDYNIVYGHVHTQELHWGGRRLSGDRHVDVFSASAGTLARVDGAVPGYTSGKSPDGTVLTSMNNWQQGLAVVSYRNGEPHSETVDLIKFQRRLDNSLEAMYGGKVFKQKV